MTSFPIFRKVQAEAWTLAAAPEGSGTDFRRRATEGGLPGPACNARAYGIKKYERMKLCSLYKEKSIGGSSLEDERA